MANPDLWTPSNAVAKAMRIAPSMPAAIDAAMTAQGMDSSTQLGPGRPMNPAWGYSTRPRAMDYAVGVNITAGDNRTQWGRTSYATLKGVIEAYDIARACIDHKISELQSMEPLFTAADGVRGDVDEAVDAARAALEFPDRDLPYLAWLAKWLEGCFRYDAGMLYRRRNLAGEVIGLDVIDGTTVTPKIDQYGRKPQPPAVAFQQIIKGLPTVDFTTDDLIPTIFRPQADSPFGLAPIESILLTANTDLRFQKHFLELFTDGTVPHGLVELPGDLSTPDQVAEWQDYWDALMLGDQAALRQLKAVPMGTKIIEFRPATFDTAFAEYLASRTAAAFGVLPQDLGLNHEMNLANGETQTDIQFRVNTLPWVRFVEGVLTRYLRYDLGLPVKLSLNTGRDKEDRLAEAQAWQILVNSGAASVDEMREELTGLPTDNENPTPRFIMSTRTGPVPLHSLFAIAGPVDPETGGPDHNQPLDTTPFDGAGGVLPDKSPGGTQFKRAPINPDDPEHPQLEHVVPGSDVLGVTASSKPLITDPAQGAQVEAQQADDDEKQLDVVKEATAGVTSATGITGVDLVGADDDEETVVDLAPSDEVAKAADLAAFRRFVAKAAKTGRWRRDFTFTAVDALAAHRLNQHARARIRKDAGQVVAAGLAVVAADTGRVLMLQRALDPADPNGGYWELPGGCLEPGEDPNRAARREWSEETGLDTPYADGGDPTPDWTSPNGLYAGYIQVVLVEADVPIFDRAEGANPDDPDGDAVEALAWWDPAQLAGNPAVRPELAATLDTVLPLIEAIGPKAASPVAKSWRDGAAKTPQHSVDLRLVDFWSPKIADALASLVTAAQLRAAIEAARAELPADGTVTKAADPAKEKIAQAVAAKLTSGADTAQIDTVVRQTIADSYRAGTMAASKQLGLTAAGLNWDTWQPGDTDAADTAVDGGLSDLLDGAGIGIKGIVGDALDGVGNTIADGLLTGLSVDDIAASLSDWTTGFRAERIAQTETARAVDAATQGVYVANGIGEFDIVLSDGACDECIDAHDAGPYPAGDSIVPVHPFCRCASSPHIPDDWTAPADDSAQQQE